MMIRHSPFEDALRAARLDLRPLAAGALSPLAPFLGRAAPERCATLALDLPDEGTVGAVAFAPDGVLATEVTCWIAPTYRGRGYASEGLRAALAWARDVWGRRCLTARHHEEAGAAARVLIKAGFLYTGRVEAAPCGHARWMVWLA